MKIEFNKSEIGPSYIGGVIAKLKKSDIAIIENFFANEFIDKNDAMGKCNRMFLDKPDKPKNWTRILEVCACVITAHK